LPATADFRRAKVLIEQFRREELRLPVKASDEAELFSKKNRLCGNEFFLLRGILGESFAQNLFLRFSLERKRRF
jgi:hypothetical protein